MCWMGIGIDLHNIFPFTDSQQLAQGLNVYTQISSDWIGLENPFCVFFFMEIQLVTSPVLPMASNLADTKCRCYISELKCCV